MMPPIRVLQIMPAMDAGGMETFVMNVYRTIDRERVQFDFLYHYDKPCFFDDESGASSTAITAGLGCFITLWPSGRASRYGAATATTLPMSRTWWASWTAS